MTYRLRTITLALFLGAASAASFASGTHADGHEGSAIGKPGQAANVSRAIKIDMTDNMRFTSADIAVKQGETIRFVVQNSGKVKHEMVLGTAKELKEHYEVMKKNPEMEHADENMISVAPGKTGEIIWQFTKSGKIDFACLQPGHYDAGMKGAVNVTVDGTISKKLPRAEHKH
ncbi:cupredoxin family protein [Polaromonas sp.]|uniref:cupredoxin domain-containing protein n=1 Tax=Polaromonas sp. TaxID=1869339 RepID=UPI0027315A13|nr:cupredoxin family protein [Polaromonas sp.]MDP1742389.1 cupredoxin family protein [Polaromonas sp.]